VKLDASRPGVVWPASAAYDEFLRRWSQHRLPPGVVRVRLFGFWANCHRQETMGLIRRPPVTAPVERFSWWVKQLVQEGGFALVWGESGTGKWHSVDSYSQYGVTL
jgi:hypothetical protein